MLHGLLSEILACDSEFEIEIVRTEGSIFPKDADSFVLAFAELKARSPLSSPYPGLDEIALRTAYPDIATSFERHILYRRLPGVGRTGADRLHAAFGGDLVPSSPDLDRLAARHACDAQTLCDMLSEASGLRPNTVSTILLRAASDRILDPRTAARPAKNPVADAPEKPIQHSLFEPTQIDLFAM